MLLPGVLTAGNVPLAVGCPLALDLKSADVSRAGRPHEPRPALIRDPGRKRIDARANGAAGRPRRDGLRRAAVVAQRLKVQVRAERQIVRTRRGERKAVGVPDRAC